MGLAKTEKEFRAEMQARRAKHDLKNTPLPVKKRRNMKKMFHETNSGDINKKSSERLDAQKIDEQPNSQ